MPITSDRPETLPRRRLFRRDGLAAWLLLGLAVPAAAQQTPPCPATVAPGGLLAAWSAPIDRVAAKYANNLAAAPIPVGLALRLALSPQGEVHFVQQPGKALAQGSHAGLLGLTIGQAGTYRVALGTSAWIDLVDNTQALPSHAHAPGPACSGIHKMVDFVLAPGRYTLQLSDNAEPQTTVLVVRLP